MNTVSTHTFPMYPLQRISHAVPALNPVRGLLSRFPFGQLPSLHLLRNHLSGFVRRLHRYYRAVRLPLLVHRCRTALAFTTRPFLLSSVGEQGISRFPRELFLCMLKVSDPVGSSLGLPFRPSRCCLPHSPRASAPHAWLTRLNTRPAHSFINASWLNLRTTTHDSSPVWVAI